MATLARHLASDCRLRTRIGTDPLTMSLADLSISVYYTTNISSCNMENPSLNIFYTIVQIQQDFRNNHRIRNRGNNIEGNH